MFGFFKKKGNSLGIASVIQRALSQGERGLHIILFVDNQILFQVLPVHNFADHGISGKDLEGFVEYHFFNKNKTLTVSCEPAIVELHEKGEFIHYEESKGYNFYIKPIGNNPDKIEEIVMDRIQTVYSSISMDRISVDYPVY